MKILLAANAPWTATGYGTQGASLARRLRDAGHNLVYYCNYGLNGGVQEWEGITCLPTGDGGYADPIIKGHIRYTQPDLLITLQDLWPWRQTDLAAFVQEMGVRWAAWFPIDALPISQANRDMLTAATYLIPMANFAEAALKELDPELNLTVIPHGIEKEFGFTSAGRREFRRYNQIPEDAFLFGSVGRNAYYPGRKGFDRLMRAFADLQRDNAYLYIHALPNSEHGSVPLPQIADFYGITDRVKYADEYNGVMGYSQNGMNAMYSAMDCYVQPTLGEGFGIPVLEAQACGANVIATDCTSMPELLCPEASQLIPGVTELFVPDPSHRTLIDISLLTESMREIYDIKRDDPRGFDAMKARAGLWANGWDWDRIWHEEWVPFLTRVEEDIKRAPRREWHRGGGLVFEHEGNMRKQDSSLKSPAVAKELAFIATHQHENIVPVLRSGVDGDGTSWFDMPKMRSLRDIQPDSLTDEQRTKIVDGVRAGLEFLHENHRAHRDVCPENILIGDDFTPYLTDFEWSHQCDGEIGVDCVDFEPWAVPKSAVAVVQTGMEQRGFHTIIQYIHGIDLSEKSHGFKGVPYQQMDGVGERDCQIRWDIMNPDVKGKMVVDLGSNLGWFVRKAQEGGALSVIGVENDLAVVNAAKAMGGEYLSADLDDGDYPDGVFDVAFALSVLQHLKDPDRTFDWLMGHAKTIYMEMPPRFITPKMAEAVYRYGTNLGESERGRPIFRLDVP